MPYEYGWILAEVVRGATGRRLDEFIHTEISAAAGIPGLRFGATAAELPGLAKTYWLGSGSVKVAGVELSTTFEHDNNLPEVLTAFVPGAGLVCTASDLAAFYEVLVRGGVTQSGKRLVSAETLSRYTTAGGMTFDRSNRLPLRVGRGFLLGSLTPSIYGWWGTQRCFGHAGAFCTLAWADLSETWQWPSSPTATGGRTRASSASLRWARACDECDKTCLPDTFCHSYLQDRGRMGPSRRRGISMGRGFHMALEETAALRLLDASGDTARFLQAGPERGGLRLHVGLLSGATRVLRARRSYRPLRRLLDLD
jgi:hypothetical protein